METGIKRYSVILIPFPPNPKVQEEIMELTKEYFNDRPEILRTDIFEGLSFKWRDWYGLNGCDRPWQRFKSGLERIYERSGEELLIIDWMDEGDWEYVDMEDRKQYAEVFSVRYENGDASLTLYPSFFRLSQGNHLTEAEYDVKLYKDLAKGDAIPIFEKLWRRGLIDIRAF